MIKAAGVLFVAHDQVLLLKRADTGEWAFPGGQIEEGESIEEGAVRECQEEMGGLPDGRREPFDHSANDDVDFTTFVQACEPFNPTLNDEHTGFVWASLNDYPQPLHPGAAATLAKLTRTELDVARDMSIGILPSPQKFQGVTMFDLRVTGTGQTFRSKDRQHVFRPDEHYLTPEFLARCNGLPVVWMHPEKSMLNSKEFGERVIGAIFLPYIKGDEVWAISRIYDADAIAEMTAAQLSTSPGVKFRTMAICTTVPIEGGATLLLEGNPHLLDHLAVLAEGVNGVWDKGGDPTGVNSIITGDETMTDEEKAAAAIADRAKKDAEEKEAKMKADADNDRWAKMDKFCDSMGKFADSVKARFDSEDKAKADAEEKAKADAAEKEKADKKDAEEKEAKDKKDAEEKAAKEKADAEVAAKLAADAAEDGDEAAMADAQSKCDSVAQAFGKRAPAPLRGEKVMAYRKRLLGAYKVHSADYKDIDVGIINDAAMLAVVEKRVFADAMQAAMHPVDVPVGQLREITRVDPDTGVRITSFFGQGTFIGAMKRPSLRVTEIHTKNRSH
jgi:8-oxo-dGTP pyrophosphatase MutT (NUDIX family)